MELRVLQYFLAITREHSISAAAESLHLSQSTLSRQIKELEEELGHDLFIRGNRCITLTEEGHILKQRAEEILQLVNKTEQQINQLDNISGDIYIGAGETPAICWIAKAFKKVLQQYPSIRCHIISGDTSDVLEQLDKGLIDFGLLFSNEKLVKYHHLLLPCIENGGVLMRKDDRLADKQYITPSDLWNQPFILSRQHTDGGILSAWLQKDISKLNVVATYTLLYNCSKFVEEGIGYAICRDGMIDVSKNSPLCFRPLSPATQTSMQLIWKKYVPLSSAANIFLTALQDLVNS